MGRMKTKHKKITKKKLFVVSCNIQYKQTTKTQNEKQKCNLLKK